MVNLRRAGPADQNPEDPTNRKPDNKKWLKDWKYKKPWDQKTEFCDNYGALNT